MAREAPAGRRFRLTPAQRLKQSWEFGRTRLEGRRVVKGCLILNWKIADDAGKREDGGKTQECARLGVVTSRKIGNAVVRSRARRLLRAVFRRHQHDFARPLDMVLVARQSIAEMDYAQVERDFMAAARQARLVHDPS